MTIKYNVTGAKRKELVLKIAEWLGCEAKYKGAPSFAYEVDYFTIDKEGTLIFDDRADSEVIERLLEMLYDNGFEAESLPKAAETEAEEEPQTICGSIFIPKETFTDSGRENLKKLVKAKGNLIKKALDIETAEITEGEDFMEFPWISDSISPDEVPAIMNFINALCEMARNQKRVTAYEKEVECEKYAFRCFLLRLGFIGSEHKETRKILLKNLDGSSAFKNGGRK